MAKWYSVLFSDIRNKLGDQVVFGNWKGRPYMRTYVIPSNPKTLAQTAVRKHLNDTVKIWQEFISRFEDAKRAWNEAASKEGLSGFNLMVKEGMQSSISATLSGSEVTISYKIGFSLANALICMYSKTSGTATYVALPYVSEDTITVEAPTTSGTYIYFIADKRFETDDIKRGMVCRGAEDRENGDYIIAEIEV